MSTADVPGAVPANLDTLHTGCWAENADDDNSYILVEGVENGRVVYEVFDTSKTPPVAFRDVMSETRFKQRFTRAGWTWHDKTEFPWESVIQRGLQAGARPVLGQDAIDSAADIEDAMDRLADDDDTGAGGATRRVARDLGLRGRALRAEDGPASDRCAACQSLPGWFNDPETARLIDPDNLRRPRSSLH